jgi:hypothetical protein
MHIFRRLGLQNSDRMQRRYKGYIAPPGEQARPIGGFYAGSTPQLPFFHDAHHE